MPNTADPAAAGPAVVHRGARRGNWEALAHRSAELMPGLEPELQRNRHIPRAALLRRNLAEVGRLLSAGGPVIAERQIRIARIEVVEEVRGIHAQLKLSGFLPQAERFEDGHVHVLESGTPEQRGRRVTKP
jgi:hypothetical protein